jgi:hypothetical protein
MYAAVSGNSEHQPRGLSREFIVHASALTGSMPSFSWSERVNMLLSSASRARDWQGPDCQQDRRERILTSCLGAIVWVGLAAGSFTRVALMLGSRARYRLKGLVITSIICSPKT